MDQSSRELSPSAGHYVLTYGVVVLLWLLLVGSLQPDGVFIGLIVGAIVTALMSPRLSIMAGVRRSFCFFQCQQALPLRATNRVPARDSRCRRGLGDQRGWILKID